MKFITKSTKTTSIVASVITAISLITLIMLSALLPINTSAKTLMCFIYSVILLMILLLWRGALQIKVFDDYKAKRSMLCADGILSLCLGILLIITGVLFATLQASKVFKGIAITATDIRYFIIVFLFILVAWQTLVAVLAFKEKRFNSICELLFAILWFALDIIFAVSFAKVNLILIAWLIIGISWALIALTIFYMLFSYVIKTPKYLETEEAIEIYNKEQEEIKLRRERALNGTSSNSQNNSIKDRLRKLQELKEQNLITASEYKERKSEILKDI